MVTPLEAKRHPPSDDCGGDTLTAAPIPSDTHWWNFWICGSEAAIYIAAMRMMGPLTLIPFLFKQTGIDEAWLGLFTISTLLSALGGPIGAAWAGGREWKLPFCLRVGFLQRLPLFVVPLGAMFLFSRPGMLLVVLVAAWVATNYIGGVGQPVYTVVLTTGTREHWWGRMIGTRNVLASVAGLLTAALVWWINHVCAVPHNYIVMGWLGVGMLFVSLFLVSRLREVPVRVQRYLDRQPLGETLRAIWGLYRDDPRLRWVVIARVVRSCGFVVGTYYTAVFIERCGLTETQMWLPLTLTCVSEISAHTLGGWVVDRFGPKPALVASSALICINSFWLMHCYSLAGFVLLFPSISIGGSLLTNSWMTLVMKLAPGEARHMYWSAIALGSAPGSILASLAGVLLVRWHGFDYVFYLSAAGGLVAALLFYFKTPHLRPHTA